MQPGRRRPLASIRCVDHKRGADRVQAVGEDKRQGKNDGGREGWDHSI